MRLISECSKRVAYGIAMTVNTKAAKVMFMNISTSIVGTDIRMSNLDIRLSRLDIRMSVPTMLVLEMVKMFFPLHENNSRMITRNSEKFKVNKFNTERYRNSAIPYLQNLLNEENKAKNDFIRARGT